MSDDDSGARPPSEDVDDAPRITCTTCDREWTLAYELDEMRLGNQSFEQFALDHKRHTGHFPDDVTPWLTDCRRCPQGDAFLSEGAARRWATTHARHTRHPVTVRHGDEAETITDSE